MSRFSLSLLITQHTLQYIPVFKNENSKSDISTSCYLTVKHPNTAKVIDDAQMTFNTDGHFNYTVPGNVLNTTGSYPSSIRCDNGADYGFSSFPLTVTPTGSINESILDNPVALILVLAALVFLILGLVYTNAYLGFIGGALFMLSGVYFMIYGFGNITDLYTRGIATVFIGVGTLFMIVAAYEWLPDEFRI